MVRHQPGKGFQHNIETHFAGTVDQIWSSSEVEIHEQFEQVRHCKRKRASKTQKPRRPLAAVLLRGTPFPPGMCLFSYAALAARLRMALTPMAAVRMRAASLAGVTRSAMGLWMQSSFSNCSWEPLFRCWDNGRGFPESMGLAGDCRLCLRWDGLPFDEDPWLFQAVCWLSEACVLWLQACGACFGF